VLVGDTKRGIGIVELMRCMGYARGMRAVVDMADLIDAVIIREIEVVARKRLGIMRRKDGLMSKL